MQSKLIVIDGIDGSGKETQTRLLKEYFEENGKSVRKISFPDYEKPSSALVKMYLNGEIGKASDINVYAASGFYAADRYISYKTDWEKDVNEKDYIVADRYTTSNIIHQMVRLDKTERKSYIEWLYDYEYGKMGLPSPDLIIYLDMPPKITRKLIEKRYNGDNNKKDILESDYEYMEQCRESALYAAEKLNWQVIPCFEEEEPLEIRDIQKQIRNCVNKYFNIN